MLINCPLCGPRDLREFTIKGAYKAAPHGDTWSEDWHDYLHLRDNPAGVTRELWQHTGGCGAWLIVTRNTLTHEITAVELAQDMAHAD